MKLSIGRRKAGLALTASVIALAGPLALAADAGVGYAARGAGAGHLDLDVSWACENNRARLTIDGTADFGEATTEIAVVPSSGKSNASAAQSLVKGYTTSLTFEFTDEIDIAKSPRDGGVGGNPYIWLQIEDQNFLLGRCHGNLNERRIERLQIDTVYDILSEIDLGAVSCKNQGSELAIGLFNQVDPVVGKIIFSQQADPESRRTAEVDGDFGDLTLGVENATWAKRGGWQQNGPGGNPFVYARTQLVDYTGNQQRLDRGLELAGQLPGTWTFIGRCSDLRKAAR